MALRAKAQSLVAQALNSTADDDRFKSRQAKYPLLTRMGRVPADLRGILIENNTSSLFHSLAFRMATYDDERLFGRWDSLLSRVCNLDGWEAEYSNWNDALDHWAIKWNKFNQFLWMLQCCEYFLDEGADVSFPYSNNTAKPDILVKSDDFQIYVECYFFTKWWGGEHLVEDVLYAVDPNLSIKRQHNLRYDNNSFASGPDPEKAATTVLAELSENLKPCKLADLRERAKVTTPVEVCKIGDFVVRLAGEGDYHGGANRHGDPKNSWPVFRDEILRRKGNANGLSSHRPNLLLVNCLGLDYQFSLEEGAGDHDLPDSLDQVWFCACGVGDKMQESSRLEVRRRTS